MESVTIIFPVHNEEATVGRLLEEFSTSLSSAGFRPLFLAVDDGSTDGTVRVLLKAKTQGYSIKIVSLSRNFGQHPALFAGMDHCQESDLYLLTDADLQNPPKRAAEMLTFLSKNHYDIVYGIRNDVRIGNGAFSRVLWFFLWLFSRFHIPNNQTPFKVFTKSYLKSFRALRKHGDFLPTVLAEVGAKVGFVPVETVPRASGRSKYNFAKKGRLFVVALASVIFRRNKYLIYKVAAVYE